MSLLRGDVCVEYDVVGGWDAWSGWVMSSFFLDHLHFLGVTHLCLYFYSNTSRN